MGRMVVVVIALLMSSCSTKTTAPAQKPSQPVSAQKQQVYDKLGADAEESSNKDRSFTLYKKEIQDPTNGLPVLKYIVVRNDDQRIVEEGAITMGAIDWSADYELEVSQGKGQVQLSRSENSSKRKIDLRPYLARDGRR